MRLSPSATTRVEKAAADNGFDLARGVVGDWIPFASSYAPLEIWVTADADGGLVVAVSRLDVALAMADLGARWEGPLPAGARGSRKVSDVPGLHRLLRRAYQLARALPNELLHEFERRTGSLPSNTEAERLVIQRVGQDLFRGGLLDYWDGRCAITGLAIPELLRASHIKPWASCESDAERLDVFNGLLLAPHLDALFDKGFITVTDDGEVVVSPVVNGFARDALGVAIPMRVEALADGHRQYLPWHRERLFRRGS